MTLNITSLINILVVFQLFVFTFFLASKRNHLKANLILALFLFSQAMGILNSFLFRNSDSFINFPYLFFVGDPFKYLWGPTFYLYVTALTRKNFTLKKNLIWHAVPFLVVLMAQVILFHVQPTPFKLEVIQTWPAMVQHYSNLSVWFIYFQIFIYNILAIYKIKTHRRVIKQQFSSISKINLSWLNFVLYGYLVAYSVSLTGFIIRQTVPAFWDYMLGTTYITFFVFFNIIFYKGLSQPEIFSGTEPPQKYKSSQLTDEQKQNLIKRLEHCMKTDQPFLNYDLTLNDLAQKLDTSSRHLSQVINEQYEQNFYDFINKFRIEESKRMLSDPLFQDKTVLEILYETGFNTKSAFNAAFKKHTGTTPSAYRKENVVKAI